MQNFTAVLRLFFVLIVILLCAGVMAWFWAEEQLPQMAADKFGPPDPALRFPQRSLYAGRVLTNQRSLLTALDAAGQPRTFAVDLGETVFSVANRLQDEGFISSADAFRTFLIYAGLDTGVQAGEYLLSPAMTPVEIARALQDAVPEEVDFNILSGWRVEEIAAALPTSGLAVSVNDFMALVRNPPVEILPAGFQEGATLEGFLMPGSYQIKRSISARDLVATFLQRFDEEITPDLRDAISARGLTLSDAAVLASMVEREAMLTEEKPMIASVFYNRLEIGMKLDSDPTTQYALGYQISSQTWWKNPLTRDDLQVESRYNTYIYPGLPPGPICNPGLDAFRAVAYPAETGYFYFRARCDGSGRHAFSITYEEHLQNACP